MKRAQIGKKHIPLIIGNWKLNPSTLEKAIKLAHEVKKSTAQKGAASHVALAAPFVFIQSVAKTIGKSRVQLAAQDVSAQEAGAFTGEISVSMLRSVGVEYIIAGHSERRAAGETDEQVAHKVTQILKGGITAVVCIGEKVRDQHGDYFGTVETQLRAVLGAIPQSTLRRLVVAYEPIWAIGTGKHATAEDVQEMKLFIQKVIADAVGRAAVRKVRILYGGSVNKDNAQALLEVGKADGFLVGGASLKASDFGSIVTIADTYAHT